MYSPNPFRTLDSVAKTYMKMQENFRVDALKGIGAEWRGGVKKGDEIDYYDPEKGDKHLGYVTRVGKDDYTVQDAYTKKKYKFKYSTAKKPSHLEQVEVEEEKKELQPSAEMDSAEKEGAKDEKKKQAEKKKNVAAADEKDDAVDDSADDDNDAKDDGTDDDGDDDDTVNININQDKEDDKKDNNGKDKMKKKFSKEELDAFAAVEEAFTKKKDDDAIDKDSTSDDDKPTKKDGEGEKDESELKKKKDVLDTKPKLERKGMVGEKIDYMSLRAQ